MNDARHRLLPEPRVTFSHDENGRPTGAYIKVREGTAYKAVQPNPAHLVYFYIGYDELPIGFKFLEPAAGVALSTVTSMLIQDGDGRPEGVALKGDHRFLSLEAFMEYLRSVESAEKQVSEELESAHCG
jgi:hypothetical protein